ncbi:MAG TPA: serine hydrolase domain-containing protein [Chloroflexota bacterium]|nr:serine hydrolase domain-containing protein [Chloroflexota bacterium]
MHREDQQVRDVALVAEIDALLRERYQPDQPGVAVIVSRRGTVIYRGGHGLANLELGVKIEPHMVFRLGSITKQFTAAAILILRDEGKLSLDHPITTYLPDYPMHDQTITIEHLLRHTSGISNYTGLPSFLTNQRQDLSLDQLIDTFKNEPLDFVPGAKWDYSNSGYILLGAIIEKASGLSYEEFLQKRIFEPLGMSHSGYDHTERIVPGRVAGYQTGATGLENAPYLSMTIPRAAGALISSVEDLAVWNEALATGKLLGPETVYQAWTSGTLTNGDAHGYGYGWSLFVYAGHRVVEHAGGIHGFLTDGIYFPDERLYVAVLGNLLAAEAAPDKTALRIAGLVIGAPYHEPSTVPLPPARRAALTGVYLEDDEKEWHLINQDDSLVLQAKGGQCLGLYPISEGEFRTDELLARVRVEEEGGAITALVSQGRNGLVQRLIRTDRPLPELG